MWHDWCGRETINARFASPSFSFIVSPIIPLLFFSLGYRKARRVVEKIVVPVLEAAHVAYTTVATQYRGFATEHVAALGTREE